MPRYPQQHPYRHGDPARLGILMTNLGTPDAPTPSALRRYLREFLSDPRVVELPRLIWLPVLHGIILNTRPRRSAAAYARVWTEAGSPLLVHARAQVEAVGAALASHIPGPFVIRLAMRYGQPSIAEALAAFRAQGVQRLLVLPLYPQYAAATTASTFDALAKVFTRERWLPELRLINGYHAEPGYIAALAASVEAHWAAQGRGERLLFSFHGIPQSYFDAGDPYHCLCQMTARLTAEALGLGKESYEVCFQSRFGPRAWLKPYTDERIKALGKAGLKTLDVISPGFSADCLETLEELAILNQEFFHEAGGHALRYIPALNERPDHIAFLAELVLKHLAGWPEVADDYHPGAKRELAHLQRNLAEGMGAKNLSDMTP